MKKREAFDPVSLSFADVLTCVFGAAIIMFLIFVAIVTLDSLTGQIETNNKGYSRFKMRSIQENINSGFATATIRFLMEESSLLDLSELDSAIDILRQSGPKCGNSINSDCNARKLNVNTIISNTKNMYGVQYHLDEGLNEHFSITLAKKITQGKHFEVYAMVSVGGMLKCQRVSLSNSHSGLIFEIGPKVDGFLHSKLPTRSC